MKPIEEEKKLKIIEEELAILKATQSVQTKRITALNLERKQLIKSIEDKKVQPISITDHALVRYIERIYGLDTEKLRKEILNQELQELAKTLGGSGKYTFNNITFVLDNYKIVTIYQ